MSDLLLHSLNSKGLAPALDVKDAEALAKDTLKELARLDVYPQSITANDGAVYFLGCRGTDKYLGLVSREASAGEPFKAQQERTEVRGETVVVTLAPALPDAAAQLRNALPFLQPCLFGTRKSAGCGDRLGLATPGHLRSFSKCDLAPILAQQSVRENERTGRTPQQVLDDAMWGVFLAGWREGYGADADHLKTRADVDSFAAAGYTFYTIDPGEYVDYDAATAPPDVLTAKFEQLPWERLERTSDDLLEAMADTKLDVEGFTVDISRLDLIRAAVKYGRVVNHTVDLYRHLCQVMGDRPFELEVSVDETDSDTTLFEHIYIVSELKRLGVKWISLAPRYVGEFEKGVDYIGDLGHFRRSFEQHAAVARVYGPYKLSLHSGSDKFSVYPIATELTRGLVHLKTAGTSYLEALRTIARINPGLFRTIARFARERYPEDRASYHVSAEVEKMPDPDHAADEHLPGFLEDFHAREILHVTYGSVLNDQRSRGPFFDELRGNEELYSQVLETHFDKHFNGFK